MDALHETMTHYVPALVLRRLAVPHESAPEHFDAAVLFADISGFTALTERLAQHGDEGVERLIRLLNGYFGTLVERIAAHGGDVVKFAGDALLALWPADDPEALRVEVLRAARCALELQASLQAHAAGDDERLTLRVGLGAGPVATTHIGGVRDRWEFVVVGDPFAQVALAQREAHVGEVVLSPAAWAALGEAGAGDVLQSGAVRLRSVREVPPRAIVLPAAPDQPDRLRGYIPGAILSRLSAGQTDWLAELRRVTVLFVGVPELSAVASLSRAHEVMRALQGALYRYEGSVNKLSVDDKGVTLVAALGLPPLSHEDDAGRAVGAALAMQAALDALGVRYAVGVATGRVFCGVVGHARRREYTMIGDVVNLAARLMQAADGAVLCDGATYQAARARYAFEALAPVRVKGKEEPVAVFRPTGRGGVPVARVAAPLVGRAVERVALGARTEALARGGPGGVVVLEGEAGLGKSRLLADTLERATALGLATLRGAAEEVERATPYYAWRAVFAVVLGFDAGDDGATRTARVAAQLADNPEAARFAPLLEDLAPVEIPETGLTRHMTGQVRADNTRDLAVWLLTSYTRGAPLVLALEDAHWFDSASWALVRAVAEGAPHVLLVLTTRPAVDAPSAELDAVLRADAAQPLRLRLQPMAPDEVLALVRERLGARTLADGLASAVLAKAEGHPYFTEELVSALRDAGHVVVTDGRAELRATAESADGIALPETIQGAITGRIDRLPPAQQLTLKVASIVGRAFELSVLRAVFPIEAEREHLGAHLAALEHAGLVVRVAREPDAEYVFRHAITQDVAYGLMLVAQRRQLHGALAEWYERERAADLTALYPLLAHHWEKAGVGGKVVRCLVRAGEHALRGGAYAEAVASLSRALSLDPATCREDELNHGEWERLLAEAYLGLGRMADGREHLTRALTLLGAPLPATPARMAASLGGQLVRQALHRAFPRAFALRDAGARAAFIEAARAYERLGEVHYYANDTLPLLYASVRGLNLAEAAGTSPVLARIYGNMALAAGLLPLRALAALYDRRAIETAAAIEEQSARAWVAMLTGTCAVALAHWEDARVAYERSAAISGRLGDRRYWEMSASALAMIVAHHDGDVDESEARFAAILASGLRSGNTQAQCWGLLGHVEIALRRGAVGTAAQSMARAHALLHASIGRTEEIRVHALGALVALRLLRWDDARAHADAALRLMARSPPTAFYSLGGYAAVAEVFLALTERAAPGTPERAALWGRAARACALLGQYARAFMLGRPRALLCAGRLAMLRERPRVARWFYRRAVSAAERFAMPHERALARGALATLDTARS